MADLGSSLDTILKRFGGGTFSDVIDRARQKQFQRKNQQSVLQSGLRQQEERNRAETAFDISERIRRTTVPTQQERLQEDLARTQREVLFQRDQPDRIRIGNEPQPGQSAGVSGQLNVFAQGRGTSLAEENIRSESVIGQRLREAGLADIISQTGQRDVTTGILQKGAAGARSAQRAQVELIRSVIDALRGNQKSGAAGNIIQQGTGLDPALSRFLDLTQP